MFATFILGGILQILFGLFSLVKFIRLVPHPVMFGSVNGLDIIIFMAQFPNFYQKGTDHLLESSALFLILGLVLLTKAIIWGLPKLTKVVLSSLVAILVVSAMVIGFGIDTMTVADTLNEGETIKSDFPPLSNFTISFTWEHLCSFYLMLPLLPV